MVDVIFHYVQFFYICSSEENWMENFNSYPYLTIVFFFAPFISMVIEMVFALREDNKCGRP